MIGRCFGLVLCLTVSSIVTFGQELEKAFALQYTHPDSAIQIAQNVLISTSDSTIASDCYEVIGIANLVKGIWEDSRQAHYKALQIRRNLDYSRGVAYSYNNLGLVYYQMGNYPTALEMYHNSLDRAEGLTDSLLQSNVHGNIGLLYRSQGDEEKALHFFQLGLDFTEGTKYTRQMANANNNMALVYRSQDEVDKALQHWGAALNYYRQLDDEKGEALTLNNMGLVYSDRGEINYSDSLFERALSIYRRWEDYDGLAMVLGNLGMNAKIHGQFDDALAFCREAYELSGKRGKTDYLLNACLCLADVFELTAQPDSSLKYLWEHMHLTDSLHRAESNRQIGLMHQQYEFQKERLQAAIERDRERTIAHEEIKRQELLRNASLVVGVLVLLLLIVLFGSYRRKQRANRLLKTRNTLIVHQREEIARKSQAITESINYARRLQTARLPDEALFSRYFNQHYVFYQPRDIVSGDFYWLEQVDGLLYLAVADCTGHGVPGALVSMIGIQGLNSALFERHLREPGAILDDLNASVSRAFAKSDNRFSDGLDIALLAIDKSSCKLQYSGAFNPLWIASASPEIAGTEVKLTARDYYLHEVKADRISLGANHQNMCYSTHTVKFNPSDCLILFSDGMPDQFGGSRFKKFGGRRFAELILTVAQQNKFQSIAVSFEEWKGKHAQLDDVTVICVRPDGVK